jgi:hypothetical protein
MPADLLSRPIGLHAPGATRPCSSVSKQFWRVNRARLDEGPAPEADGRPRGANRGGYGKRSDPNWPEVFMRLSMVPVAPTAPLRPLTTRSAAQRERRDMIVRLSFSTEIGADRKLNRPDVRHTHGLHSAIELLLFALAEPSIFLSLAQPRDGNVASLVDKGDQIAATL